MELNLKKNLGKMVDGRRVGTCPVCHQLGLIAIVPGAAFTIDVVHPGGESHSIRGVTLLQIKEAADLSGVHEQTLYSAGSAQRQRIQITRIGLDHRRKFIHVKDLADYWANTHLGRPRRVPVVE